MMILVPGIGAAVGAVAGEDEGSSPSPGGVTSTDGTGAL